MGIVESVMHCTWDPAGLVWHGKRPKAGNGKKKEIEMENGRKLDRGKNGRKMAQKWRKIMENSLNNPAIFGPFFCHFSAPVQLRAVFHFDFLFFSISGFWPFSMPYQPGRIPSTAQCHLSQNCYIAAPYFWIINCGHRNVETTAHKFQRKTKGQQLKDKIVSEFFTLFHNFSHFS